MSGRPRRIGVAALWIVLTFPAPAAPEPPPFPAGRVAGCSRISLDREPPPSTARRALAAEEPIPTTVLRLPFVL